MEVVIGTYDPFLIGFDLITDSNEDTGYRFEPKFVDRGHAGCVKSVAVDSSGTLLASGSTDETIRLFSLKDHKELGSLHQHEGSVTCLTFCGNSHMISASEDKTICVWQCKTWECLKILKGHKGAVNSASVHPSGRLAMSVSKDKHLRTWNLVTGRSAYVTNIKEVATLIRWSPCGDSYSFVTGNKVVIYKVATAALSFTMELPKPVLDVKFLNETVLAVAGEMDGIHVFDSENQKTLQIITGHESRIKALQVVHDPLLGDSKVKCILLSVSSDGDLRAWSLNPDDLSEQALLLARYEMNGRPTCMTVAVTRPKPTPFKGQEETPKPESNSDRRTTSESAGIPKKKKTKKKRKRSSKKKTSKEEAEAGSPTREDEAAEKDDQEEAMSEED
ncbi:p21-activated protein kinase-interacting protein 1-like [Nematostella vectensis]|uniref:p21-activated protein kinase-interacting protein 1-like n=1 Tax=Nematostella vectensis TaxID=45351 RepID=UPI0020773A4E|nr:p21-activated protein kinase-interacting protein 1-like [Nematostella vectensis]